MTRRIGGAGGGSDPGPKTDQKKPAPKRAGPVVAAAVLAGSVAVAGGGIGAGGSSLGGSASIGPTNSSVGKTLKVRKTRSKKAARRGNTREAWRRMGMRRLKKERDTHFGCLAHSFGEVREFFLHTPCRSLARALYGVGDGAGNVAAVSVARVTMGSRGQAWRFRRLIDIHGTGDIRPLGGVLLESYGVTFTGHNYDSRPVGRAIVIAETETVSGYFSRDTLDAIAEVAALMPPSR